MKRKGIFNVKFIDDSIVAVSAEKTDDGRKAVKLNETGLLLWKLLINDTDIDELTKALTDEYNVDEYTAKNDVEHFVDKLRNSDLLDE